MEKRYLHSLSFLKLQSIGKAEKLWLTKIRKQKQTKSCEFRTRYVYSNSFDIYRETNCNRHILDCLMQPWINIRII